MVNKQHIYIVRSCHVILNASLWAQFVTRIVRTRKFAVSKDHAGDRQRNAEVDRPPRVRLPVGVHAAVLGVICLATAVDGITGRVTTQRVDVHADLSGRHVGRHVTHFVCVR